MLPRGPLLRVKPTPNTRKPADVLKPTNVPLTRSVSAGHHQVPAEGKPTPTYEQQIRKAISIADFSFIIVAGFGSFGKVWKANHSRSGAVYAVKSMNKIK